MMDSLSTEKPRIKPEDFNIDDLTDEVRVDGLCRTLLKHFHHHLHNSGDFGQREAGSLAHGADYFLRDFVIDCSRSNIFLVTAAHVRGFAGNWYIHRNLEPNISELTSILCGITEFYRFCAVCSWVSASDSEEISLACSELDYYRQRIDSFHDLVGDDYEEWCQECPLT